jgi:hypothetical protein
MSRRAHLCGWPDCDVKVHAWQWGCGKHFAELPAAHRDALVRVKHYWPEAKAIREAATKWARDHLREEREACRKCGGPPSPRLRNYCVACHIADITGDRS